MPTSATSGPLFTVSSPSAGLQSCLESRLRARLDVNGSPEFGLTWRPVDMPAGPPLFRLAPSGRRTGGSGFTGWPTPKAIDVIQPRRDLSKMKPKGHWGAGMNTGSLSETAQLVSWPTPVVQDAANARNATAVRRNPESAHHSGTMLLDAVTMASWPTPNATEREMTAEEYRRRNTALKAANANLGTLQLGLGTAVQMASWPTPQNRDHKGAPGKTARANGGFQASLPADIASASGPAPNGSPGPTARRGALNPEFVCWLMGYPTAWDACAATATLSCRRSRRRS